MKDLRLFCYGERTYGSGSKKSEQQLRNEMNAFTLNHSDFELLLLDRIIRSTLSL